MRKFCIALILLCALLAALPAHAEESTLSYDKGSADTFEKLATDGHYIQFSSPAWPHTFIDELQVYGYRFGNVGNTMGTVVVWDLQPAPKPAKPPARGEKPAPTKQARIIFSKQFKLTDAPEQAGWFSVPLEPTELPRHFGVSLFTRSSDTAGLWVGLTPKAKLASHSSAGIIKDLAEASRIKMRRDGRDWLIRLRVRDTVKPQAEFTTAQLTGSEFAVLDDGTAEGFATAQIDGPIVKFNNEGGRRVRRVFVYAKLGGTDWFNTDRKAGVWLLNEHYGILWRGDLPFRNYTNEPSWSYIDLPDIPLPRTFYILVEPISRPQTQMLIGYDSSGQNRASMFGSAGAIHKWSIEAPEDKTNWMIRVEYR